MMPLASLVERAEYYMRFYQRYALDHWNSLTPMQYGCLLVGIGLFGWFLMKSSIQK